MDIVERLRMKNAQPWVTKKESADEIEALRKENKKLKQQFANISGTILRLLKD